MAPVRVNIVKLNTIFFQKPNTTSLVKNFPLRSLNGTVHYRVHKNPFIDSILNQFNPTHTLYIQFKIYSNITFQLINYILITNLMY